MRTDTVVQHGGAFSEVPYAVPPTEYRAMGGSGVPRGGWFGVFKPPSRNSEDIGGVLDRTSKKNRRLDSLL